SAGRAFAESGNRMPGLALAYNSGATRRIFTIDTEAAGRALADAHHAAPALALSQQALAPPSACTPFVSPLPSTPAEFSPLAVPVTATLSFPLASPLSALICASPLSLVCRLCGLLPC